MGHIAERASQQKPLVTSRLPLDVLLRAKRRKPRIEAAIHEAGQFVLQIRVQSSETGFTSWP
jgi:hypothetical protein